MSPVIFQRSMGFFKTSNFKKFYLEFDLSDFYFDFIYGFLTQIFTCGENFS